MDDIYSKSRDFASNIFGKESNNSISVAIDSGSTGTEILMRLKFELQKIRTDEQLSDDNLSVCNSIIDDISRALKC